MTEAEAELIIEAKRRRARLIEILEACTCLFPIQRMQNDHGHAPDCQATSIIARMLVEEQKSR